MMVFIIEYFLNVFLKCNYCFYDVIFRSCFSLLSAYFFSCLMGPCFISYFKKLNICQIIRTTGPRLHVIKQGTPTMGGIIILFSIILSILLWSNLCNRYVWYVIFILIGYGIIGFFDDYYKIIKKNSHGLSILLKYCLLSIVALLLLVIMFILERNVTGTQFLIPCFSNTIIHLGIWYVFLGYLMIVGTSNSINLSDGLDGLVIMPIVFIAFGLGLMAWLISNNLYSVSYMDVKNVILFEDFVIICGAIIGSGLGFLWFNAYPAQIFMGDVGSLSLGGTLAVIAFSLRQEILFLIMIAGFILETLSVIFQVLFFKLRGYRIFLMAPIHHHYELMGCPESRIVVRFWIITLMLVLISLVIFRMC